MRSVKDTIYTIPLTVNVGQFLRSLVKTSVVILTVHPVAVAAALDLSLNLVIVNSLEAWYHFFFQLL
jgi:hypothetical protein